MPREAGRAAGGRPHPGGYSRAVPNLESGNRRRVLLWLGIVLALTAIAYSPSLSAGFTNWDDDVYVTSNPAVLHPSLAGVIRFFGSFHNGNYHPLTMLSLAIDGGILGPGPPVFHAVNLGLHLANTALVLWLVLLLFGLEVAVPAALLFGIHPLHVESVAWISERKDVLYTLFYLLALTVYARAIAKEPGAQARAQPIQASKTSDRRRRAISQERGQAPSEPRDRTSRDAVEDAQDPMPDRRQGISPRTGSEQPGTRVKWLALSILFFVLSLLSKGQAVTLAPTLFLVDALRGRKLLERRSLLEKVPFFLLALAFGLIAIHAQRSAAAIFDHASRSILDRALFASYGLVMYLVKLIAPLRLSAVYPYPSPAGGALPMIFSVCLAASLALITGTIVIAKTSRAVFFGLAFFLVNIGPVLQLLPVGNAIMADRYSYVPSIGIFILAGLAYSALAGSSRGTGSPLRRGIALGAPVLGAAYVLFLAWMTFVRCGVWEDSLSLWTDTAAKSPSSEIAWSSLGSVHDDMGRDAEALEDYTKAVTINPGFGKAFASRARCKNRLGDRDGARQDAERALQLRPDLSYVHTTRGVVALGDNDPSIAEASFRKAMEIDPSDAEAYAGRGAVKRSRGDLKGALEDLETAVHLDPRSSEVVSNRGILKAEAGDTAGALADFQMAIQLSPGKPGSYINRAILRMKSGDSNAACADLRAAQQRGARLPANVVSRACGP